MHNKRSVVLIIVISLFVWTVSYSQTNDDKELNEYKPEKVFGNLYDSVHYINNDKAIYEEKGKIQFLKFPFQVNSIHLQDSLAHTDFFKKNTIPTRINNSNQFFDQSNYTSSKKSYSKQGDVYFQKTHFSNESPTNWRLISSDGSLVAAMWEGENSEGLSELRITTSNDGGLTFSPPKALFDGPGFIITSQIEVVEGNIFLLWVAETENGGSDLYLAVSSDGGSTYSEPINVSLSPETVSNLFGSMIVQGQNLTVFWGEDDGKDELYAASSFDGGATFESPIPISNRKGERVYGPWIAQGPQGELYASWQADAGINFAKSTDFGRTFSKPETIMPGTCCFRTLHVNGEKIFMQAARAVRVSEDGGSSWKSIFPGIESQSSTFATSSELYISGTKWNESNSTYTPKLSVSNNWGVDFSQFNLDQSKKAECFGWIDIVAIGKDAAVWWPEPDPQTDGCGFNKQNLVVHTTNDGGKTLNEPVRFPANYGSIMSYVFLNHDLVEVIWPKISDNGQEATLKYSYSENGGKKYNTFEVESELYSVLLDAAQNGERTHFIYESVNGLYIATKLDEEIPPPPSNLSVKATEEGPILSWDASVHDNLESYIIYAGEDIDNLDVLDTVPTESTSYNELDDKSSFFIVSAKSKPGFESPKSNLVSYVKHQINVGDKWQMVSSPINESTTNFKNAQLFDFNRTYKRTDKIEPNEGAWIRGDIDEELNIRGEGLIQAEVNVEQGWSLIGSLADVVPISSISSDPNHVLTEAPIYYYQNGTYQEASELNPGIGYWIYAGREGSIEFEIGEPQIKEKKDNNEQNMDLVRLYFQSTTGNQDFWISSQPLTAKQEMRFILPPKAPNPGLDVRTNSDFSVGQEDKVQLEITSGSWPVKVTMAKSRYSTIHEYIYRITAKSGENEVHFKLLEGQSVDINRQYDNLILEKIPVGETITEYHISSNYPNPFNPSTNISYQLPKESHVMVEVFDIAGRRVASLVDATQRAGVYTVRFDGSNQASGIYFLRFQAEQFTEIQKLTLIK